MIIHNALELEIGSLVRLSGITRHGRNRVRENGSLAEVVNIDGKDSDVLATKFCVRHVENWDNWRWIDVPEDEDMNWELVKANNEFHIE
mgnify:CR=1 FL=1|jgi:hypothetical protein